MHHHVNDGLLGPSGGKGGSESNGNLSIVNEPAFVPNWFSTDVSQSHAPG